MHNTYYVILKYTLQAPSKVLPNHIYELYCQLQSFNHHTNSYFFGFNVVQTDTNILFRLYNSSSSRTSLNGNILLWVYQKSNLKPHKPFICCKDICSMWDFFLLPFSAFICRISLKRARHTSCTLILYNPRVVLVQCLSIWPIFFPPHIHSWFIGSEILS